MSLQKESVEMKSNTVELDTPQGRIRGVVNDIGDGSRCKVFYGIPYAEPPVGQLRFKNPIALSKWKQTILDATTSKQGSVRVYQHAIKMFRGSEDSLYVDVFIPEMVNKLEEKLPVMVWIPDGNFRCGGRPADYSQYQYLLPKRVIVVVVFSRQGALGFFNLDDLSLNVTGNQGLKDQVLALQWVRKYIKYYGGDETNVTLIGLSSGSCCIHLHTLSPLARGLFDKAILMSGTALTPGCMRIPDKINSCKQFAKYMGCQFEEDEKVLEFLQNQKLEDICEAQQNWTDLVGSFDVDFRGIYPFHPIIENAKATGAYLTEDPEMLIEQNHVYQVPMLICYTRDDTFYFSLVISELSQTHNHRLTCYIPPMFKHYTRQSGSNILDIENAVNRYYFGGQSTFGKEFPRKSEDFQNFLKNVQDAKVLRGIHKIAKYFQQQSTGSEPPNIYICEVNLLTKLNEIYYNAYRTVSTFFPSLDVTGSCPHGTELLYIKAKTLEENIEIIKPGSVEERCVDVMTRLWTNFAKYSDPNGKKNESCNSEATYWSPVSTTSENLEFFSISNNQEIMQSSSEYTARFKFWEKMLDLAQNKEHSFSKSKI